MNHKNTWRLWCVSCSLILAAGCGYLKSGTWEDDPEANWKRVFGYAKPDDVVVVHSRYWRSPHWSYEAAYEFEIAPNQKFREQLFSRNRLVRLGEAAEEPKQLCFTECPAWFAPKPRAAYDVWGYADEPKGNFRVLIDRSTGAIFLTDYQV